MNKVVTRIPPSPTGRLHIGTARTALFNYLFARHAGGSVVFRSEDTDRARSKKEYEDEIIEGLHWLGLSWDAFSRQSEHAPRHRELLEQIVAAGTAYVSKEESKMEKGKMVEVVRLKNPGRSITFHDEIRGDITFDSTELGDFVIARAIDDPIYHFAVVADDMDADITHVIRGEDHISNTTRQILIQEALGAPRPAYAHLPLILDEKRAKLSKRSGTVLSLHDYRDEGFLPEAMVNYVALLGWSPGTDEEHFSLAELVKRFTLEGVQKGGAAWNREKLLSVNQRWMRELSDTDFIARGALEAVDEKVLRRAVPLLKERTRTFDEARELLSGELSCLFSSPKFSREALVAKECGTPTKPLLQTLLVPLQDLPDNATPEIVKSVLMPLADAEEARGKGGRGALLWPFRYALSGQEKSPDPFTLVSLIGKEEALARVKKAIAILEE
ncbi:glutamate--tRNA ligase [Candidatus Kaiserbacteria bacterium]|nr:glutamate--tRNA ligase [Candidatus Kaiserbacteria bacterium]